MRSSVPDRFERDRTRARPRRDRQFVRQPRRIERRHPAHAGQLLGRARHNCLPRALSVLWLPPHLRPLPHCLHSHPKTRATRCARLYTTRFQTVLQGNGAAPTSQKDDVTSSQSRWHVLQTNGTAWKETSELTLSTFRVRNQDTELNIFRIPHDRKLRPAPRPGPENIGKHVM